MSYPLGVYEILSYGRNLIKSTEKISIAKQASQHTKALEDHLINVLKKYIHSVITYSDAYNAFMSTDATTRPLDQIKSILDESLIAQPIVLSEKESHSNKVRRWSQREDTRLLAGVFLYGADDWNQISYFVGAGRGRPQCLQRWTRTLNPKILKDVWTEQDDAKLLRAVGQYDKVSWTKIANIMGDRSDVQCRYHYSQLMKQKAQAKKTSPSSTNFNAAIQDVSQSTSSMISQERSRFIPSIVQGIYSFNCQQIPMAVDDFLSCFS